MNERKRNDWRDVGTLIEVMQDLILDQQRPLKKSMELVSLQDQLRNVNLDIDTVEETFLDHPGLWDKGRRLLFLLEFVGEKIARINDYNDPLVREIEKNKVDILPEDFRLDWKDHFTKVHVASMENNKIEYLTHQKMIRDNLKDYGSTYKMIVDEGKYKYNGNSTIDYLRFMRNCTSHFYKYEYASMYECINTFRELQPRILMTLYNINKRHV